MASFLRHLRSGRRFVTLLLILVICAPLALFAKLMLPIAPNWAKRFGARWCQRWCRWTIRFSGLEVQTPLLPEEESFLFVSNHVSYLDIWVLGSLRPLAFIAKKEIRHWPLMGFVAEAAGTLFVDRSSARNAIQTARQMEGHLSHGIPLVLFPEGRAGDGSAILPFRAALLEPIARAEIPCYAIAIQYETPGESTSPSKTISWTDNRNLMQHAWSMLAIPRVIATVRLNPEPHRNTDRKALATALESSVRQLFRPLSS